MTKHLVLAGLINPQIANDATDGFVELNADEAAVVQDAFVDGFFITEDLSSVVDDPDAIAKFMSALAGSSYTVAKENASQDTLSGRGTIKDRLKSIKDKGSKGA